MDLHSRNTFTGILTKNENAFALRKKQGINSTLILMGDWCGLKKTAIRKQLKMRAQEKRKTKTCLERSVRPAKKR